LAKFVKGEVVVISLPFSEYKKRPALVVSSLDRGDLILCQITSKATKDEYAISINDCDFDSGGLKQPCNVRPNCIFTANSDIVLYRMGVLDIEKLIEITETIVEILRT